ncbi:hypothetical protein MAPG_10876 [Magnaporthiopsis poae ATCC 64411]|uniref:Uncharacterized protein n=1 Tax=Magnaporthiopsis poae (strain ATCC 64411 / 73-15) TaxID=644358 RepID=A0A0C4EDR7_MAGP6|nr:hypothetical protein MAPG_10876 [Magnaporthiopsis poae ATCC 64411]
MGDPERGIVVPVGGGPAFNVPPARGPSIIVPPSPLPNQKKRSGIIITPGQVTPLRNLGHGSEDPERGIVVPVGGGPAFNVPPTLVRSLPNQPATVASKRGPPASANAGKFLRVFRSKHSTTSANIGVRLPGCWEGDINIATRSGRIDIEGKDVRIVNQAEDLPGFNRHVVARKGDQDNDHSSPVTITTVSGDAGVAVGKV